MRALERWAHAYLHERRHQIPEDYEEYEMAHAIVARAMDVQLGTAKLYVSRKWFPGEAGLRPLFPDGRMSTFPSVGDVVVERVKWHDEWAEPSTQEFVVMSRNWHDLSAYARQMRGPDAEPLPEKWCWTMWLVRRDRMNAESEWRWPSSQPFEGHYDSQWITVGHIDELPEFDYATRRFRAPAPERAPDLLDLLGDWS